MATTYRYAGDAGGCVLRGFADRGQQFIHRGD